MTNSKSFKEYAAEAKAKATELGNPANWKNFLPEKIKNNLTIVLF